MSKTEDFQLEGKEDLMHEYFDIKTVFKHYSHKRIGLKLNHALVILGKIN